MDVAGWRATNSPATAVMSSEFCRDIRGWTGTCMHFPALYPSAPREQSSLCLWVTGLLSRQPEAIPFHACTLPYPHLQFNHSANSVPEAPPPSRDDKKSLQMESPSQPATGHFFQLPQISETNYSNLLATLLLFTSSVLSPLQKDSSQT